MAPTQPSPSTWTMRFKQGKITIILHVDPLDSFLNIKAELLRCLRLTHADGHLEPSKPIPDSPHDILLATPIDPTNYTKGWIPLYSDLPSLQDTIDVVTEDRSTGRLERSKGTNRRAGALEATPKSAGLINACELAFRFLEQDRHREITEEKVWDVEQLTYDDLTAPHVEGEEGIVSDLEV